MERNRWETAIRCLEIAVHPHTGDAEVIAAINGFRRTAGKTPFAQLCRELGNAPGHLLSRLDQLHRANLALRRKAEEADAGRVAALRDLQDARQRAQDLEAELLAAERRAAIAEQRLVEFQGAYGRISGGLRGENDGLRRALDEARRDLAQPIHEPVRPFQSALHAALQRLDPPPRSPAPAASRPWTA